MDKAAAEEKTVVHGLYFLLLLTFVLPMPIAFAVDFEPEAYAATCPKGTDYFKDKLRHAEAVRDYWDQARQKGAPQSCPTSPAMGRIKIPELSAALYPVIRRNAPGTIPIQCINSSLQAVSEAGVYRANCSSDTTLLPPQAGKRKVPPHCRTRAFVEHIHWWTNQAVDCMSTDQSPLEAREIFALLNHESRFEVNVFSKMGNGIGQLTTAGAAAAADTMNLIRPKGRRQKQVQNPFTPLALQKWIEAAETNHACAPFRDLMAPTAKPLNVLANRRDGKVTSLNHITLMSCQFLNIATNPGRALIYSLGLYQTARDSAIEMLNACGSSCLPTEREVAIKKMTRLIYNQGAGPVRAGLAALLDRRASFGGAADLVGELEKETGVYLGRPDYNYSTLVDNDLQLIEEATGTCEKR